MARVAVERHGDAVPARLAARAGALRLGVPPGATVARTPAVSGLAAAIPVDDSVESAPAALRP